MMIDVARYMLLVLESFNFESYCHKKVHTLLHSLDRIEQPRATQVLSYGDVLTKQTIIIVKFIRTDMPFYFITGQLIRDIASPQCH